MSGHSKWATIKRKKAANDSKRGKLFTRFLKEIQVAAKMGGGNIEGNPRLKAAVASAKAQSVPNDNIERAIKRGSGDEEGVNYEEVMYEGYGPGGVGILVRTLTDNRNRTVADVRSVLTRYNGAMGGANSVSYQFKERGVFTISKKGLSEDDLMAIVLEAGADDIRDQGEDWEVVCETESYNNVREAIEKSGKTFEGSLQLVPETLIPINGDNARTLLKLLDALDDLDDVQSVVANFDIADSELQELGS